MTTQEIQVPDIGDFRDVPVIEIHVAPGDVVAVEDTEAGVASARAAGLRVVAVTGTLPPDRLAEADALTERVDLRLMRRLLAST
jgi:beta-phosphoglucomutase-like phosphatase (HAD superfamily)